MAVGQFVNNHNKGKNTQEVIKNTCEGHTGVLVTLSMRESGKVLQYFCDCYAPVIASLHTASYGRFTKLNVERRKCISFRFLVYV